MAIRLISNYSKKLGLPGYSSHMFSVSIETELATTADVPAETGRLYELLQSNVDKQIQQVGFVPPYDYGMDPAAQANGAAPAPNAAAGASALAAALAAAIASVNGPAGPPPSNRANPASSGSANNGSNGANGANGANWQRGPAWKCSDKQREFILKLVDEHQLNKHDVEALAVERFGHGVCLLDKIEASGLIEELLETHGGKGQGKGKGQAKRGNGSAYGGANGRRGA